MGKRIILITAVLAAALYMAGCGVISVWQGTNTPEATNTPQATATPEVTPPSPSPSLSPSPSPTPTPAPTPTPRITPTPSPTPAPTPAGESVQADTHPIYSVARSDKVVALSFDASWGATYTMDLLDTLDAYNAKATFFLVAFWVDAYPDLVQEIHNRGQAIGNHSSTHSHMSELSDAEVAQELSGCQDKIDALIGSPECLVFRPPYGDYDADMLKVCADMGYYSIQWDVDTLDWEGLSAAEIEDRVMSRVGPGSIVLMHNEGEHTAEALPNILQKLSDQGYRFVTIPELIYKDHYRIDGNGTQQPIN